MTGSVVAPGRHAGLGSSHPRFMLSQGLRLRRSSCLSASAPAPDTSPFSRSHVQIQQEQGSELFGWPPCPRGLDFSRRDGPRHCLPLGWASIPPGRISHFPVPCSKALQRGYGRGRYADLTGSAYGPRLPGSKTFPPENTGFPAL